MAQGVQTDIRIDPADGAIGSHAAVVQAAYKDFEILARKILETMKGEIQPK